MHTHTRMGKGHRSLVAADDGRKRARPGIEAFPDWHRDRFRRPLCYGCKASEEVRPDLAQHNRPLKRIAPLE